MTKNVLIIGGAGFIGSHLCSLLRRETSHRLIVLDNYSTGSRDNHVSGVDYINGESHEVKQLVQSKVDLVYHLGEYSRVEQSFNEFAKLWQSNIHGTKEVIEFAAASSAKLVYAGSSTKFSDNKLTIPQTPYVWSKVVNTELVVQYSEWYGLDYAITYFYNAYGPREISRGPYATVIGIFKEKTRRGERLPIVSPGSQMRNFTHVRDTVAALKLVGEKGSGDNFGIGSKESFAIIDVAKLFGGEIEFLPERYGNRASAQLVTARTEALGWQCKSSLVDYVDQLKKNNWLDSK